MKPLFRDCASYISSTANNNLHLYGDFSPEHRVRIGRVSGDFLPKDPIPETPIHISRVLLYRELVAKEKAS